MKKLHLILVLVILANSLPFFSQNTVNKTISEGDLIVLLDGSKKGIDTIVLNSKEFSQLKLVLNDSVFLKNTLNANAQKLDLINRTLSNNQNNDKSFFKPFTLDKALLLFTPLLLIGFVVYTLIEKKKLRDKILFTVTGFNRGNSNEPRIEQWRNGIVNEAINKAKADQNELVSIKTNISDLKRNVENILSRLKEFENDSKPTSNSIQQKSEISKQVHKPKILYADAIVNDQFNRVTESPNEDTVYEIILQNTSDKSGGFTVYKDAFRRVLMNPDFVDGCEKQKLDLAPTDLKVDKGTTQLNDYGKWIIVNKANVKFI